MSRKAKGPGYTPRSGKSPAFKMMGSSPVKFDPKNDPSSGDQSGMMGSSEYFPSENPENITNILDKIKKGDTVDEDDATLELESEEDEQANSGKGGKSSDGLNYDIWKKDAETGKVTMDKGKGAALGVGVLGKMLQSADSGEKTKSFAQHQDAFASKGSFEEGNLLSQNPFAKKSPTKKSGFKMKKSSAKNYGKNK